MTRLFARSLSTAGVALFGLALAACSASTAHIGSLQTGKDQDVSTAVSTFDPHDTVYAKGDAANVPSAVTLKWQLVAENVKGQPPNAAQPNDDVSKDFSSDGTSTYTLTPPPNGWPPGTYKIVLTMIDDGKQRDQKTTEFTVPGS